MTTTTTSPETLVATFRQVVVERVQIPVGGTVYDYAGYLLLPDTVRGNDEANAVDQQFARAALEWLGFTQAEWVYNVPQAGQKGNRPDYLVRGSIGTAFIWEDKNTMLDLEAEHIQQMRRYSTGTAGYAVWCNMRRILAVRFLSNESYEKLVDVNVVGLFGAQALLPAEQEEQATQIALLHLLFSKERFTSFARLVAQIAVDEPTWRARVQPLDAPQATQQFIADSRESLNHLRLSALGQIRDALSRRTANAVEERRLQAEWLVERDAFLTSALFPAVRERLQQAIAPLESRLGELTLDQLRAVWTVLDNGLLEVGPRRTLRPAYDRWFERATRINSALLALRFQASNTARIVDAFQVWSERQSDPEDVTATVFAEQVAYVFFVRLLLVRVLEDKGVLSPRLASDGGFQEWTGYIKHRFRELDGISILHEIYTRLLTRKAEQYYLHFFQQGVFNWFLPDDFLFVETLEFLCRYDFAQVTSDIIGFTYEEYIDRTARNRKGHFLTRSEVVEYMLDLLGYTGGEVLGRNMLDPACGSGSFLVHAAQRYRQALITAMSAAAGVADDLAALPPEARQELARQYLAALTTLFVGIELNPFACYLAEMNLLIQALDDLFVLYAAGEGRTIERFQVYNSNSLDLPRELLDSTDVTVTGGLLHVPDRLSDRLFDEAHAIKARLNGYVPGFFYIISNPPYVTPKREGLDLTRYRTVPFYQAILSGDTNLYLLFLRLGLYYLADYGRMVFIQPLTLFGDSSASAARTLLNTPPFAVRAAVRFYRGDVLFPGVDQAVGIVLVQRSVQPNTVLVSGGENVVQARAAQSEANPAQVLQAVPQNGMWFGNWLVSDDPAILAVWQHVRGQSNTLSYRLGTLLDATFDSKQGDVNATYLNPLRVRPATSHAPGDIAVYKGEDVDRFAPLPAQPSDWARPLAVGATGGSARETITVSQVLVRLTELKTPEQGIVLRETARLNTRERLIVTWFERVSTTPVVFEHTLWRMVLRADVTPSQAKGVLALVNSATVAYLLNLFSTNNHVSKDELSRLPIPDPATFPAAALAALAEQLLALRATLEHDAVRQYGAVLPEAGADAVYLPPSRVLAGATLPKITLQTLVLRGLVKNLGAATGRIEALRRRGLFRYTGSDAQVADMLMAFLDEPGRGELTWTAAQSISLPDPIAVAAWHGAYQTLAATAQAQWQQFVALQAQVDDVVATWYNFDAAMRATIAAGLPWARRRTSSTATAVSLPNMLISTPAGRTTRTPVVSSNVYAIGYDAPSQTLEIEFTNGEVYAYREVPLEVWAQFQAAASQGSFYSRKIRGRYVGERI